MKKNINGIVVFIIVFFVGVIIGISNTKYFSICRSNLGYINKEFRCDNKKIIKKYGYVEFKEKLKLFINSKIANKEVSEVSFYFRDLEEGPTLGINEHALFSPASLFKVPYLIAYLKLAEENPEILNTKLGFRIEDEDPNKGQTFSPAEIAQENTPYSIDELLKKMIIYSDNRSLRVLADYLNQISSAKNFIYEISYNMGIISRNGTANEYVTVKSYASLFIIVRP